MRFRETINLPAKSEATTNIYAFFHLGRTKCRASSIDSESFGIFFCRSMELKRVCISNELWHPGQQFEKFWHCLSLSVWANFCQFFQTLVMNLMTQNAIQWCRKYAFSRNHQLACQIGGYDEHLRIFPSRMHQMRGVKHRFSKFLDFFLAINGIKPRLYFHRAAAPNSTVQKDLRSLFSLCFSKLLSVLPNLRGGTNDPTCYPVIPKICVFAKPSTCLPNPRLRRTPTHFSI